MPRGPLFVLPLLLFAAAPAQAQDSFQVSHSAPVLVAKTNPDDLVARILSFDRNSDGKVTTEELNERMQPLVSRNDRNGDGALDSTELRTIASTPVQNPTSVRGFPASLGGYGFGDEFGQSSSRLHIEGAIEDLRLAAATRERALAVVKTFLDTLEASARAALLKEMEGLLTPDQLADFTSALETGGSDRIAKLFTVTRTVGTDGQRQGVVRPILVALQETNMAIEVRLLEYRLPPSQDSQARAAIKRFDARLRLDDEDRSALVGQLSSILGGEERDNFRAAIDRRPVVKAGGVAGLGKKFVAIRTVDFADAVTVHPGDGVAP